MYRKEARLRAMIDPDKKNAWGGLDDEDREAIAWAIKVIESRDAELKDLRQEISRRYIDGINARVQLKELATKLAETVNRI